MGRELTARRLALRLWSHRRRARRRPAGHAEPTGRRVVILMLVHY